MASTSGRLLGSEGVAGVPLGHGARLLLLPGPARLVLIGRDVETAEGKVQG